MDKNKKLQEFWNQVFLMDENTKENIRKDIKEEDWQDLAPSKKLFDAVCSLNDCDNILDYGCGNGWASVISAKSGTAHIDAVDTSKNAIDSLNFFIDVFNLKAKINAFSIDFEWLKNQKEGYYDGLVCSNVLDVVDEDTSNVIIETLNRVLKKGAKIIIGLNYYISAEKAKAKAIVFENNNELYVDGILRLLNKSDEEWINSFSKYFKVIKLDHFAWPNETVETRRLFYLEK